MGLLADLLARRCSRRWILISLLAPFLFGFGFYKPTHARVLYVQAAAHAGGNGSRRDPYNSLDAVEKASAEKDTIIVLPSPAGVLPLDGGIALKAGQRLTGAGRSVFSATSKDPAPRITNSSGAHNSGDAVVLAANTEVSNLYIVHPWRNGIFGRDVVGAVVRDNQIAGQNQSCKEGFRIYSFTMISGTRKMFIPGISGGWAAVDVEFTHLLDTGKVSVLHNFIHDADCGDGVNFHLSGTTHAIIKVEDNVFKDLRQGDFKIPGVSNTVLGIGTQTADHSELTLDASNNLMDNLGSGKLPRGANADGFLLNLGGTSEQNIHINHHTYRDSEKRGGVSANGFAIATMQKGSVRANVVIENSTFSGAPGDILEFALLGNDAKVNATIRNTVATGSIGTGVLPGSFFVNNGTCMLAVNEGNDNSFSLRVTDSRFENCSGPGVGIFSQFSMPSLHVSIDRSSLTHNRFANLFIETLLPPGSLSVKVQRSDFSKSPDKGILLRETHGLTSSSAIDLGGGSLGSLGQNTIANNGTDLEVENCDVTAERNWWGSSAGPRSTAIHIVGSATVNSAPFLTKAPHYYSKH